jgi:type III restriction enzyme
VQKFESDAERRLAVILERDALKWFRPARGQFQIFYRDGADHREYQPDFVAEAADAIYMLEPKMRKELDDPVAMAKKQVAVDWCLNASTHAISNGGKPWKYLLIPHDAIAENMTLSGLVSQFGTYALCRRRPASGGSQPPARGHGAGSHTRRHSPRRGYSHAEARPFL